MTAQEYAEHLKRSGSIQMTIPEIDARLRRIGYRLDRSCDCSSVARFVAGDLAGESYPVTCTGVVECDTGMGFSHVNARRDANFRELQRMRFNTEVFAIVRGRVFEI